VEGQLPQLRARVDKLQGQLQAFRQQNNLLDPESQGQQLANRVSTIEGEQLDTQVKLREASDPSTQHSRRSWDCHQNQAIATATLSEAPGYLEVTQTSSLKLKPR
jgi:succinoglycan biosynthesis transport protein ExoP